MALFKLSLLDIQKQMFEHKSLFMSHHHRVDWHFWKCQALNNHNRKQIISLIGTNLKWAKKKKSMNEMSVNKLDNRRPPNQQKQANHQTRSNASSWLNQRMTRKKIPQDNSLVIRDDFETWKNSLFVMEKKMLWFVFAFLTLCLSVCLSPCLFIV